MRVHQVKLAVITDTDGKVVATKQLVDPGASAEFAVYSRLVAEQQLGGGTSFALPAYSRIVARPEQQHHELEVELPETIFATGDVSEIHRIVQADIDRMKGG